MTVSIWYEHALIYSSDIAFACYSLSTASPSATTLLTTTTLGMLAFTPFSASTGILLTPYTANY